MKERGVSAQTVVLDGDAASQIIAYSEQEASDLVAMATHGRSGIERFVMGSIAEKVVRHTTKPVLLIRAIPAIPPQVDWRQITLPPAP